ncbi:MAG: XrtA system polysaccharide deacetylase [Planctomycetota bacterium]
MKKPSVLNAFTIDVEGFVESNVQSFNIPEKYIDSSKENHEIEENTHYVMQLLEEAGVKATFFFVGRIARDIPRLIRTVADAGHEIGCHNYAHVRIFNLEQENFRENLSTAKKSLEDVSGQKVYGFRAPDFSITNKSLWALDILKELGFLYDSSIYPVGLHDVYGIKDASSEIIQLPNQLIEVPMSTVEILGNRIQLAGGGYFRLYPLWLTKMLMRKINSKGRPCVFYIHPYEVGPEIPLIREISPYRKFRHYYNCKNGKKRVRYLLQSFDFTSVINILRKNNFI